MPGFRVDGHMYEMKNMDESSKAKQTLFNSVLKA